MDQPADTGRDHQQVSSAPGAEEEQEVVPDAPLVFQCVGCRCIVGDSFSFVCADEALGLVCLSSVTGEVTVSQRPTLSTAGADEGCVYKDLMCKTCKSHKLGKLYTATPKQLVHMQQLFSLDTEAITSFVLGSAEQWADGQALERLPTVQHLRSLNGDLVKLQHVLVGIDERLQSIERAMQDRGFMMQLSSDATGLKTEQNGRSLEHSRTADGGTSKRKREN